MRIRRTTQQWQALFNEQQQSGLSVKEFCKQHGLNPKYFYIKRQNMCDQNAAASPFVVATGPKETPKSQPEPHTLTLHYHQCQLHVSSEVEAQWLIDLMRGLA